MPKPSVNVNPPANAHTAPNERIIEVFDKDSQAGLLISLRSDDGVLRVELYRADDGVVVVSSVRQTSVYPAT